MSMYAWAWQEVLYAQAELTRIKNDEAPDMNACSDSAFSNDEKLAQHGHTGTQ